MNMLFIRFLIGGSVVMVFALLGDVLRPKSFAGLFGAAPSIALATIFLTIHQNGRAYAATECRSMMLGAVAFSIYAGAVSWILRRYKPSTLLATIGLMPIWFAVSFGILVLIERSA
jgi:uncharacterized membrane protein (GlpM family)